MWGHPRGEPGKVELHLSNWAIGWVRTGDFLTVFARPMELEFDDLVSLLIPDWTHEWSSQIYVEFRSAVNVHLAECSLRNASALESYSGLNTLTHYPIEEQSLTFQVLLFSGVIVDYLHIMPGTARVKATWTSVLQVLSWK